MKGRGDLGGRVAWWRGAILALVFTQACNCEDMVDQPQGRWEPKVYGTYIPPSRPLLDAPSVVDFGQVALGERAERVIEVKNVGRSPLHFSSWVIEPAAFSLSFEGFMGGSVPVSLEPGSSLKLRLGFTGTPSGQAAGRLVIKSDDVNAPEHTITLRAGLDFPCVEVEPEKTLDFGPVRLDNRVVQEVTLSNCSATQPLELSLLVSDTDDVTGFTVEQPERFSGLVLAPGESAVKVPVRFAPLRQGEHRDALVFATNVPDQELYKVELVGRGAPLACPTPVISANGAQNNATANPRATLAALPLETIGLNADESFSANGSQITRVEWSVISRPQDSAARLSDLSSSFENSLWLDLSGDYTVELDVWDANGTKSCSPARLTMRAIPNESFHIQLVWDTPNDRDQLDDQGTDVDLHLLHPRGNWNAVPYDCFWQNPEADWGERGEPNDDPSLDIDDTDGWGPENINMDHPEENARYKVGVHYFSDHGFGPSYATVRFYLEGMLVREYKRQRLVDQQFWQVFEIAWPEKRITDLNNISNEIPNPI